MLTRFKVNGFKNLLDVDIWFGPFTCIAGANGVGKSNLFDAITFLRLLASEPLLDAALSIRDEAAKGGDIRSLFYQAPGHDIGDMSFSAEMIVSKTAMDELRQEAKATNTFLKYDLAIRYRGESSYLGPLEVVRESLTYITKGDSRDHLPFPHNPVEWRKSWLEAAGKVAGKAFISTVGETEDDRVIRVHQDKTGGRPQPRKASILPRTVLSMVNASEAPTAVAARQEMMNWKLLQFEPSALRANDPFRATRAVSSSGAHMPAALFGLLHQGRIGPSKKTSSTPDVSATITSRVSELVNDVREVWVDEDDKRELLTLYARLKDGTVHPARSLSDGTLRFLALAIIEQTPQSGGLYCLEEPENGIHPERIPAVLKLLEDIANDADEPVDEVDNPLRQVIINTHSPSVVMQVPEDSLVVAFKRDMRRDGIKTPGLAFAALPDTWRTLKKVHFSDHSGPLMELCPKSVLISYLNPIPKEEADSRRGVMERVYTRVIDRADVGQLRIFKD